MLDLNNQPDRPRRPAEQSRRSFFGGESCRPRPAALGQAALSADRRAQEGGEVEDGGGGVEKFILQICLLKECTH
jgi:hypothetical protein